MPKTECDDLGDEAYLRIITRLEGEGDSQAAEIIRIQWETIKNKRPVVPPSPTPRS